MGMEGFTTITQRALALGMGLQPLITAVPKYVRWSSPVDMLRVQMEVCPHASAT
jgi:hypothetical protein